MLQRVTTWQARLAELLRGTDAIPYRHWVGTYPEAYGPVLGTVAREWGIPVRVSEERYPDLPGQVILYWRGPVVSLTAYWREVERRTGWSPLTPTPSAIRET